MILVASRYSLAQTKRDFYCVWMHRFVAVKVLQWLHAVGFLALSVIAVPDYGRYHFLAMRVFVTCFQRLVTCTLEVQYWVVDWRRFRTYINTVTKTHIIVDCSKIIIYYVRRKPIRKRVGWILENWWFW